MNTKTEDHEQDFNAIEELTAYLDGELDDAAVTKVESRLNSDPAYLAEMQSLQRTWDILDSLPQAEPKASFTKTTMELVVGEALKDSKSKRKWSWAWLPRAAIILGLPAILFATAFGLTRNVQLEPDRLLIENLTAVENHYRYPDAMHGDDVEFLVKLNERGLFLQNADFDENENIVFTPTQNIIPSTLEERKKYVSELDVEQKIALQEKLSAFTSLNDAERKKRIAFDRKLHAHDESPQLVQVLKSYTDWLNNNLESGQKAPLQDEIDLAGSIKEKIDIISDIRYEQSRDIFGKTGAARLPSANDVRTVYLWYESVVNAKEKHIRDHFPKALAQFEKRTGKKNKSSKKMIERRARQSPLPNLVAYLMKVDEKFLKEVLLDDQEMDTLYSVLTAQARYELDGLSLARQRDLMMQWIESANQSRWEVSSERLKQFESQLSDKERDELDRMSIENYRKTLKEKLRDRMIQKQDELEDWEAFLNYEDFGN